MSKPSNKDTTKPQKITRILQKPIRTSNRKSVEVMCNKHVKSVLMIFNLDLNNRRTTFCSERLDHILYFANEPAAQETQKTKVLNIIMLN